MRRFLSVLLALALVWLSAAGEDWVVDDDEDAVLPDRSAQARVLMRRMTLEEKVWQMMIVTPEDLTGESVTQELGKTNVFVARSAGGVAVFGQNIVSEEQLKTLISDMQGQAEKAGLYPLFIAVSEEGGAWSRVANKLGYQKVPGAPDIGRTQDPAQAYAAGENVGAYLTALGINLDFAPVADVLTKEDAWIQKRAYGTNPVTVSEMARQMAAGLRSRGMVSCYMHFPGQGSIDGNLNNREVANTRALEEMRAADWLPFRDAAQNGADMIMVSHAPSRAAGDKLPASLSPVVIGQWLRGELQYQGVIVTDSLRMGAIRTLYRAGEAAVMAVEAGADILLLPYNADSAAAAILRAVDSGEITVERIDESVERILALKIERGIIR